MAQENKVTNINEKVINLKATINKLIQEETIKQSGSNNHLNVEYWQIDDFLPNAIIEMQKKKINDRILLNKETGCKLYFENCEPPYDSVLAVEIPYEEAEMLGKGGTASRVDKVQRLGATISYLRRYLLETGLGLPKRDDFENMLTQQQLKDIETQVKSKNDIAQLLKDLPYEKEIKTAFKVKILEYYNVDDWKDLVIADYAEALDLFTELKDKYEAQLKEGDLAK